MTITFDWVDGFSKFKSLNRLFFKVRKNGDVRNTLPAIFNEEIVI